MNILFISLDDYSDLQTRGTYTDVLREFVKNGHSVYAISPTEKNGIPLISQVDSLTTIIKPQVVSSQKTTFIKKGLSVVSMPFVLKRAINKCKVVKNVKFDLILYATPPVTIAPVIKYLKSKNPGASCFLLLKDIWPQVAIDVGMLKSSGVKGCISRLLHVYEKMLYKTSDIIGCMSPKNMEYVCENNRSEKNKVILCPNSMEPFHVEKSATSIREKYGIRKDDIVFLYGGNIGIMQGIPFLCQCLSEIEKYPNMRFVVCGKGTEYEQVHEYILHHKLSNSILINGLPRQEFEELTSECDYGMVYLDWRATTPNFPSRILPYMNNFKPIIACTDTTTDVGFIIENNGFGWWVPSNDVSKFDDVLRKVMDNPCYDDMCRKSHQYLIEHYTSQETYRIICKNIKK